VDVHTVWECGLNGVSVSADGGQTWEDVAANARGQSCMLSFLDDATGWIHTRQGLWMTTDGGETLQEIALPGGIETIMGISLRTPTDGYVVDSAGVLYTTSDGGQTWSSQTLGVDLETYTIILPTSDTTTAAVRFADADHGVVVVNLAGGGQVRVVALRTADGGQTWEEESVTSTMWGAVPYLSPDGMFLTLYDSGQITVLRYQGN
jgi:photosystem II stability/assembly factor-like uncharacterized protein